MASTVNFSDITTLSSSISTPIQEIEELVEEENVTEEEESEPCEMEKTLESTPRDILSMFTWNEENLYEYFKRLLDQLLSTRPENVMDYFDQYSRGLRFKRPPEEPMMYLQNCIKLGKMYGLIYPTLDDDEGTLKPRISDPWEYVQYFEEMGVSLPREEIYQITLSLRKLSHVEGLSKIRFWGKIFGLDRSYIVAECELTNDEIINRNEQLEAELEEEGEEEEESNLSQTDEPFYISDLFYKPRDESFLEEEEVKRRVVYKKLEKYVRPPIPKPIKPIVEKMPPEKHGEGANKKVYYVCHENGDEWILLPNVKPQHIVVAKKIRKYMKGNLLSKVDSYPPFEGTEKELLRAQIARITAGTQISPLGYYQFGTGEEADYGEGEQAEGEIVANLDYEPIPGQDQLKTSFWVHHAPHILRIGRTTYWHEPRNQGGEEMEEEIPDEDDKKKKDEEVGPPLLTPISEDVTMEMIEPWTIKCSSMLLPATGVIVVRSNLWPGAYAFAKGRLFENIYIGWGIKLSVEGFSPHYLPGQQTEYEIGPEIMEITDPTPEMEEQWKESHKPLPPPSIMPEEEGALDEVEEEQST